MIVSDMVCHRLHNQRIAQEKPDLPDQMVSWFGAMQAQDYASVRWAIGLRCSNATAATVEQAVTNKTIVRTWLMRGTLQVVAAKDVRWMLSLVSPRLIANSFRRYQQLELDDTVFAHSFDTLARVLQGGKSLTRAEIMLILEEAGISTTGQRGYHILRRAGLEGLICFGPMQGKQETFVLLEKWISHSKKMDRDEGLAELAERYFRSHGPATLPDFVWWSGLKTTDARAGLEMTKTRLHQETINGQTYWASQYESISKNPSPTAYLLPAYDEYYLGYKMRDAILDPKYDKKAVSSSGVFRPMMVIDGQIVGIWKRTLKKETLTVELSPFNQLTKAENQALLLAATQYGAFLDGSVALLRWLNSKG